MRMRTLGFADAQPFAKAMLDAVAQVASTSDGDNCEDGFKTRHDWTKLFAMNRRDAATAR
jgi:hypothetical protein